MSESLTLSSRFHFTAHPAEHTGPVSNGFLTVVAETAYEARALFSIIRDAVRVGDQPSVALEREIAEANAQKLPLSLRLRPAG